MNEYKKRKIPIYLPTYAYTYTHVYIVQVIKRLTDKLDDAPAFTEPLEDTAFEYGFNTKHLKKILNYWKGQYLPKWNEREKFLNQFPHFTTQIQG